MPTVSALLTGGVSVGILAGVVSGLFYLVVAGIRWAGLLASQLLQPPPQPCSACQKQGQRLLTCADCGSSRCEDCGHPQTDCCCKALRELKLQSGEWFHKQLNRRFKTITAHRINYDYDHGSGMDPDSLQVREFIERLVETLLSGGLDDVCVSKLHSHPEYERMFACHHGPLCEALARLSFALQMAIANKPLPEKDSPSAAHSALKQLIQDIITEAMTLPKMPNLESQVRRKTSEDSNSSLDDINLKTYEDILATAILNKVIEKYQYSKIDNYNSEIDGNSNLLHTNRNSSDGKHINYISSVKFGVGNLDDSNNELLSDDKTWKMMTDPSLSLTIEEQIEEVTTYSNSEDENEKLTSDNEGNLCMPDLKLLQRRVPFPEFGMDIVEGSEHSDPEECSDANADTQPTDLVSPIDSWEENWLFQRKRLKSGGVTTQMPVPMLVPNPSEDFRALIGDRDAEDTSDLSECSEGALEDLVLADVDSHSINDNDSFSVKEEDGDNNSKELVLLFESDKAADVINSESSTDDQKNIIEQLIDLNISNGSNAPIVDIAETQNIELLKSSIAVDCLSEFGQKDSEYTEDYAVLPQRQMDSLIKLHDGFEETKPVPKPRTVGKLNQELSSAEDQKETVSENRTKEENVDDSVCMNEFAVPPRPGITQSDDENCTLTSTGTIAEREHKKWENAPPLPNNPYSPENISKRLNKKVHSTGSNEEVKETLKQAKGETIKTVPVEKPLQINCAPNELECRRYRRDYYINSKLPMDQTSPQSEFTRDLPEMKPVHQRYQHKVITEEEPCVAKIQISMKPKASRESEDDLMKSKLVNNKESKPTELKEKNYQNDTVDPELPAPHTVENEIARWQNVINQTEQQWIKSVESAKNDVNGQDAVTVRAEKVKCNNNQLKKSDQNGFGKLNGNLEPHNNGIDLPSENGFVKKILKQVNSDGKIDLVHSKTNTFLSLENGKSASQDEIKSEKIKISRNKFTEKTNQSDQALNTLKRESLSTTSEGVTDLPTENGFVKKILKQVNSDGKMDLVHSKTNMFLPLENGKSASQDEIKSEQIKISKMKFTEKTNQSDQALNSLRCESLSTTSEGSVASSDSELANFLPSVKELAKHFLTVTDSDSSTSSPKCPSPTPKSRLPDSGSVKKPAAASPNSQNNMTDAVRYPASSRNSLSPGQPVREIYPDSGYVYTQKKVHSLTARSISREFREGLKRNLPIQMDRNLYTQGGGSDSSLSTTRSVEPRLDGDSTPGYTSDESGAVSPLLSEEIPRIRTLKSSIAFWEQMQQKNDG